MTKVSRSILCLLLPALPLASCKITNPVDSAVSSSIEDNIKEAENIDLCQQVKIISLKDFGKPPLVDDKVEKLLVGTGPDSLLVDGTPESKFEYTRALILSTHDQIANLLRRRIVESAEQAGAELSRDATYLDGPPTKQEVADAKELTYWLNATFGTCQGCDSASMNIILAVLDRKLGELKKCAWTAGGTTAGNNGAPELSLADVGPENTIKELKDFIKSENKAEKLCDVGVFYTFGDKIKCSHSYVKSSCDGYLAKGEAPKLDVPGTDKLKDVLETCVTEYGGERAGRAARIAIDKFHNALKDGDSFAQAAAEAACSGGAALMGNKIQSTPQVDFENACRDLSPFGAGFFTKERAASCFNTSASICRIALTSGSLGIYDVIPGGKSVAHDEARKIIYAAEGALCKTSKTASVACNTINEAGKQIYQAVTTGNNDWAHCVGTDKLGACIGNIYGSQGWTNNSGVAMAQQTSDGTEYRPCCWCERRFYANDSWIAKDTMFRSENWFGVIQQGDVKTGNCKFQETKVVKNQPLQHQGHDVYYKYEDCDKWYVKGEQCAVLDGTTHKVWNGKNKSWFSVHVP